MTGLIRYGDCITGPVFMFPTRQFSRGVRISKKKFVIFFVKMNGSVNFV